MADAGPEFGPNAGPRAGALKALVRIEAHLRTELADLLRRESLARVQSQQTLSLALIAQVGLCTRVLAAVRAETELWEQRGFQREALSNRS